MYTPDLTTASTLAVTGAAIAWQTIAVGVLILAGATLWTIAAVVHHRRSAR